MKKIEHIGIAVEDLAAAETIYEDILGEKSYKQEAVESEGVLTSFIKAGDSKIELLAATRPDSAIAKYIEKHGSGMHHIAFAVEDIRAEIARLQERGYRVLNPEPKRGADNKWVAFLHPKSANGVLVELCQEIDAK